MKTHSLKIQMVLQQKLYMTCIDIRDLETIGNMLNRAYLSILKETIKSTQLATNLDHSSLKRQNQLCHYTNLEVRNGVEEVIDLVWVVDRCGYGVGTLHTVVC